MNSGIMKVSVKNVMNFEQFSWIKKYDRLYQLCYLKNRQKGNELFNREKTSDWTILSFTENTSKNIQRLR